MEDRIVGRVLEGRYRILERLARGGMSTVYRALDERLDRAVAVKVMSAELSTDPAFADRFAREARVAARLTHGNAVSVFDQGADSGHVFLVMELVRGRTLRDLLRERGALPPDLAVSIMEPVLGALAAAHRAGLVHRDVKPENILLADDGAVKVADFGLARAVEADASSTRTGLMMGTVAYCPPEQIARGSADARSDVYAAGIVLYELLTGSAPFVGDSAMAVAYQHVNSDVPPPSGRRPGVPQRLDAVVQRATRRDPRARPADAGAMLAELHDTRVELGLRVVAVPPRVAIAGGGASGQRANPDATTDPSPFADSPGYLDAGLTAWGADQLTERTGYPSAGDNRTIADYPAADLVPAGAPVPTLPAVPPVGVGAAGPVGGAGAAGNAPRHGSEGRHPPAGRRRSRRRGILIVVLILALGAATGYGAWYLAVGRYHALPDLIGTAQPLATQRLESEGFAVDPTQLQSFSETAPAGTVVGTHPAPGTHVLSGRSVQLVVSKGPERFTLPEVTGQTQSQARTALQGLPITVVPSQKSDDKIPSGSVIGTDPPAATKVRRGQVVTLLVSSGPPVIAVPDVRGKSGTDASHQLTTAGFTPKLSEDYSDTVPAGTVIGQNPAGKASAVKFSVVNVIVSKGPPLVTVPNISSGTSVKSATRTLTDLGFHVTTRKLAEVVIFHEVWSVSPGAGASIPKGSTVTLTII
jgi:beta-lactam-binding protein with PASTA domain